MIAKPWCLSEKPLNPSFKDHSILSWYCTLYCWLLWFQHLKTCTFILAQIFWDKWKSPWQYHFLNIVIVTVMPHIIPVHGVASLSEIHRLTNGYASKYNIVGCLRFPLTYLIVAGTIGLLLLISLVVVFSHMTMMPRRNLESHVRCSHMIEPLGARWCLGICDIPHLNPFLCNPY